MSLDSYLVPGNWFISSRLLFRLKSVDFTLLNDLLLKCLLVTSYLHFVLFAGSHRLRCTLLYSGLAVAVAAAVVVQVNTSSLGVTASPTAKPMTGKFQSYQQPVVVVATHQQAVSVVVIAEISFCDTS